MKEKEIDKTIRDWIFTLVAVVQVCVWVCVPNLVSGKLCYAVRTIHWESKETFYRYIQ